MSDNALIDVRDLYKQYATRQGAVKSIDGVSFSVFRGETLGVVGESGCGKTTLGRMIMRLLAPTAGTIEYQGRDIFAMNPEDVSRLRQRIRMIFQNPFASFNPIYTIRKALSDVARQGGIRRSEADDRVLRLLCQTSLEPDVLDRRPANLSGGQLQRLAIVRALISDPDFVVADELTSSLDVTVQKQILALLDGLKEDYGLTMLFISHDLSVAEQACDRILVMYLGVVVEEAGSADVFDNALHPYTKMLAAARPKAFSQQKREPVLLTGDIPSALCVPPGCRFHTRCPNAIKGKCDCVRPPLARYREDHWVACHLYTEGQ